MTSNRPIGAWRGFCAIAALAVILAACGGNDGPRLPCPQLQTVSDASKQTKFVGTGRDLTDEEFFAQITNPVLACRYDDNVLESLLTFNLVTRRGPADDDRQAVVTYFVAISTTDRQILAREEFSVLFEFEGNKTRIAAFEEVEQNIPLPPERSGVDYVVYLGLSLTSDELTYNRENR